MQPTDPPGPPAVGSGARPAERADPPSLESDRLLTYRTVHVALVGRSWPGIRWITLAAPSGSISRERRTVQNAPSPDISCVATSGSSTYLAINCNRYSVTTPVFMRFTRSRERHRRQSCRRCRRCSGPRRAPGRSRDGRMDHDDETSARSPAPYVGAKYGGIGTRCR